MYKPGDLVHVGMSNGGFHINRPLELVYLHPNQEICPELWRAVTPGYKLYQQQERLLGLRIRNEVAPTPVIIDLNIILCQTQTQNAS